MCGCVFAIRFLENPVLELDKTFGGGPVGPHGCFEVGDHSGKNSLEVIGEVRSQKGVWDTRRPSIK